MSTVAAGLLAALPWAVAAAVLLSRMRFGTTLDDCPPEVPGGAPLVSVVLPARDEARNIEPCLRSILASTWRRLEVIVVDDHSADGTGELARRIAAGDERVRVIDNLPLPDGWFGKQWACETGATAARGEFLLFTDADTRHGPELLARSMRAMRDRDADLFSTVGWQEMATFWERLLQPHVFSLIIARYGDADAMNRSRDPMRKIANGQFLLVRREAYTVTGGHAAVRGYVAEDMRMAQEWCRLGLTVQLLAARDHLTTRMYHGFGELVRGWGKNVWAAGRHAFRLGPIARGVLRVAYPLPALWEIAPAVAALLALTGVVTGAVAVWGVAAWLVLTLFWGAVHWGMRSPLWLAPLHPLASVVLFGVLAGAAWRGDLVEWKGRAYHAR